MFERGELDFTCHEEIGAEGRNSKVFTATDHQLNAAIVVKRIERAAFQREDEYFAEARRLFDARHPHVVPVKFAVLTEKHIFLAMPPYEGGSVQSLLQQRHPTVREIVRIGLDFLTGLHHVHLRGLVHFDVKPSNVLLDRSGKAALTDFGLARYVNEDGLAEQDIMYATHRPPEGFQYSQFGQPADIYQAGLTLYRMAAGPKAFDEQWRAYEKDEMAAARAVIAGKLPDRSAAAYPAHIPSRLRNVIRRALQPNPDDRHSEVLALISDLGSVDEWLDWQYEQVGGLETWTTITETHVKVIELRETSANVFEVRSRTVRRHDRTERRRSVLSGDATSRAAAHKLVQNALTNLD